MKNLDLIRALKKTILYGTRALFVLLAILISSNFMHTMAYPGCTDPAAANYDAAATSDDGSCAYAIVSCGPDTYTYCYSNNEFIRFYYEAASGNDLYVLLNGGEVQGGGDFFFIWDNHEGIGSPMYTVSGPLQSGTILHSSTGKLMVQIVSGPSISCVDQGYEPVSYTVRCNPPAANGECSASTELIPSEYPGVNNTIGNLWFVENSGDPVCTGNSGADLYYSFTVVEKNTFILNVNPIGGSDVVVQVFDVCGGNQIACEDVNGNGGAEAVLLESLDPGTYTVRVHNESGDVETESSGMFLINAQHLPFAKVQDNPNNFLYACNTSDRQLEDIVGASPQTGQMPGVLDYKWGVYRVGGGYSFNWQRGGPNYSTKLDWLGMEYGETYNVYVSLLIDVPGVGPVWSEYAVADGFNLEDAGASTCTITTSNTVTDTEVRPQYSPNNAQGIPYSMCNVAVAKTVANAENYEWEFDDGINPPVYYERGSGNPSVKLSWVNCLKPNSTYQVRVRANVDGQWGAFNVAKPMSMAPTSNTALRSNICGTTRALTQFLLPNPVCIADSYEYRLTNVSTNDVHSAISTALSGGVQLNSFSPALIPGAEYVVEVKATQCGEEGDFSSSCNITIAGPQAQSDDAPAIRTFVENSATLFPNPNAGDEVRMELDGLSDGNHMVMINVYDIYGTLIQSDGFGHTGSTMSRLVRFDGSLAKGVYMIQIVIDGKSFATERLVVQ